MDGRLWWLRWFDHPHWDGGTSTYHVELALSLLPEPTALDALPMLDAALAASRTEQLFARVQAGQIPALAIGMVFLDGVAKGWLPAEPKSFRFVREDCSVQVVELRHRVGSLPLVPDHGRRTGTLLGKDARTIVPSTDSTTAIACEPHLPVGTRRNWCSHAARPSAFSTRRTGRSP
jgi:hypothetical protein